MMDDRRAQEVVCLADEDNDAHPRGRAMRDTEVAAAAGCRGAPAALRNQQPTAATSREWRLAVATTVTTAAGAMRDGAQRPIARAPTPAVSRKGRDARIVFERTYADV